jgi:hypothetical protein
LASVLRNEAAGLPKEFRLVDVPCYRKRFILRGELVDLLLIDERDEGVTSWTTDLAFAERFKGLVRPGAVSGAIFCHTPGPGEVVLNIGALWRTEAFVAAAAAYRADGGTEAAALFNFRDLQGEVVLDVPLRRTEIIALTGAASPFDEFCDLCGVPESERNKLFSETYTEFDPRYLSAESTQRVLERTVSIFRGRFPHFVEARNGRAT